MRKRPSFRQSFKGFEPEIAAAFTEAPVTRLLTNYRMVRSRAKIEATVRNARAYPVNGEEW